MSSQFSQQSSVTNLRPWWKEKKKQAHEMLFAECKYLIDQQRLRRSANIHFLRLYTNRAAASFSPHALADGIDVNGERIRLNVIKSALDAAIAQIGTNRPRPLYQTEGGDWGTIKKAEKRGKFVTGWFHILKQYMLSLDVFRDGGMCGTGIEYVYADVLGKRIRAERVLPDELLVDNQDARDGNPKIMRRIKNVSREWLAAQYREEQPALAAKVMEATCLEVDASSVQTIADPVTLVEAWKLPSYPGCGDGRKVLAVSNATLDDCEWKREGFPFALFHWNTLPMGFWGIGAVEEMAPIQIEINYIAQKIQKLMTLATTMVWTEKGSNVGEITNQDFARREFTGKPPIFQTTAAISAEYFHHLDRLYAKAYELVGITQLASSGRIPMGMESGEAMRTYNDIGSRRFQHTGQRWEQFHLDVGELICEAAKELQEAGIPVSILAPGEKAVERLAFAEIDMPRDRYILRPHPVNIMPDTPTGKIDTATKLSQIAPELGPDLLGMITGIPDLERAVQMANAPREMAEFLVAEIMEHNRYTPPDPFLNLPMTRDIATRSLLRARINGAPASRLDMLRRFIADIDEMQGQAEKAAMDQQMQQQMMLQAASQPALPPSPDAGSSQSPMPMM